MTADDVLAELARLRRDRERAERARERAITRSAPLLQEARRLGIGSVRLHEVTGLSRPTINRYAPAAGDTSQMGA